METINLYNHGHYGDLFFSRCFIKGLSEKFKINFYHYKPEKMFSDLTYVNEIHQIPNDFLQNSSNLEKGNVNTWLGVYEYLYIKGPKWYCSYSRYMKYVKTVLNYYNIPIRDYDYYIPEIEYNNLDNIINLDETFDILKTKYKKIILMCTGAVMSGQSENFNFSPIIDKLSDLFPDVLFLVTSNDIVNKNNILPTSKFFSNLLDVSYISKKIDIIVGRSSGPYIYGLTKSNLNDKTKKFICFCGDIEHASFFEYYNCDIIWSNNYEENNIINIIKQELI